MCLGLHLAALAALGARPVLGAPHSSLVHDSSSWSHKHPGPWAVHAHSWPLGPRRAPLCLGLHLAALAVLAALGARPVLGAPHSSLVHNSSSWPHTHPGPWVVPAHSWPTRRAHPWPPRRAPPCLGLPLATLAALAALGVRPTGQVWWPWKRRVSRFVVAAAPLAAPPATPCTGPVLQTRVAGHPIRQHAAVCLLSIGVEGRNGAAKGERAFAQEVGVCARRQGRSWRLCGRDRFERRPGTRGCRTRRPGTVRSAAACRRSCRMCGPTWLNRVLRHCTASCVVDGRPLEKRGWSEIESN